MKQEEDEPYADWIIVLAYLTVFGLGGAFWMTVAAYFMGEI